MGKPAWNKGLTILDERIKKGTDSMLKTRKLRNNYVANSGSFQIGHNGGGFPKGRKNHKLSIIKKKAYSEGLIKRLFGADNSSWKGGIYKLNIQIRNSRKYKDWRNKIYNSQKGMCYICKEEGTDVHHNIRFVDIITNNNINTYEESLKCDELWNLDNGTVLCKKCHSIVHNQSSI
jgi:hypothetical protein